MAGVWLGTSGFAYREWKPAFYPQDLPQKRFLEFYATQFPAVEIDASFYRIPSRDTLARWREATPPGFRFALKASRRITHWERLRLPSETLGYMTGLLSSLGDRLGVVLYQLPPNFRYDTDRLELFLASLPADQAAAFEFRHDSWFVDPVYRILERYGVALTIHDSDDGTTPQVVTSGRVYVRLRRGEYTAAEQDHWRDRFRKWQGAGLDVYAFVKHEDNPDGPLIARRLGEDL